jgi:hypothetical protein
VAHLEGGREVHRGNLALNGFGNPLAAMAGIAAPQTSRPVENLFAVNGIQKFSRLGALVLVSMVTSYFKPTGHALRRATSPFLQMFKLLILWR